MYRHFRRWFKLLIVSPEVFGERFDGRALIVCPAFILNIYLNLIIFLKITRQCEENLEDYNQMNSAKMELVLFMYAIIHICRISRIIRQPQGNALLLGLGGSGRQSAAKLAAHM